MHPTTLVLASHNRKKLAELEAFFRALDCRLLLAADLASLPEPDETGGTFEENAEIKAVAAARGTGCWAIADDSGLLVDALGGAPGVRSARFAGPNASDADNRSRLLDVLRGVPTAERIARFECRLAVSDPEGRVTLRAQGVCRGRILDAPRGSGGFGYDPLFLIPEYHRTFAELPAAVKSVLSHRARATESLLTAWRRAPLLDRHSFTRAQGCDRARRSSDG
ncbi:MAG: RdgB/HAM1 family non-canonical purine NTP pyrophosphatase [Planctomycetes bacterium]|nr:RdgB/HAM1 family non-canonical purine NTP pyrophosphatase [Planctomycetota bacterium]